MDGGTADEGMGDMHGGTTEDDMADTGAMGMGGMADINVAGQAQVSTLPPEPLAWVGYRFGGVASGGRTHAWGPAFLYAEDEARMLEVDGAERTIQPGEAVFVEDGADHTVPDGDFWAFVLTDPGADPSSGLGEGTRELASGPLEALPDGRADLRFLVVDLPARGGRTAVHTHPGPEFVYVTQGEIAYETGVQDTTVLTVGDASALPAETAVQKRNLSDAPARFWSWFVVDPDEPFSSEAAFDRE